MRQTAITLESVCYIVTDLGMYTADNAASRKRITEILSKHEPVIYGINEYPLALADNQAREARRVSI